MATPAPNHPVRLRRRVATTALVALAVGVGLELAARADDWFTHGTPFLSRFRSPDELMVRTSDGIHGRPGARYQQWSMNRLGFRGPEADSAKPEGRLRIIAAGASEVFGLYESPNHELPRQLEDTLRARVGGSCVASPPEVWNAALPGMSLPTVSQNVRLRLAKFAPDIVVLYPTPAFYLAGQPPHAAPPDSGARIREPALRRALTPRSWPRVRDQIKGLLPAPVQTRLREARIERMIRRRGPGWRYTEVPADRMEAFEQELRRFVGAVRGIGAEPVLATHGNAFFPGSLVSASPKWLPAWERFHPRAAPDVLIRFDSAAREAVVRVAADSAVALADVAARLARMERTGFADYAHFNDTGAGLAAGAIAEGTMTVLSRLPGGPCSQTVQR